MDAEDHITHQNLAHSDVINIEISGVWEDGHWKTNRSIKYKRNIKTNPLYKAACVVQVLLTHHRPVQ